MTSPPIDMWIYFVGLVKEDHWVAGVVGAVVALAFSSAAVIARWIFKRTQILASSHYREAKQFNGNWYLFHWNLIKVTDNKIRMSRLRICRRLNGSIEAVQAHPQSNNGVFKGSIKFDNQNFYLMMDCVNDSDVKSITFHRITDLRSLDVRYAVGVMAGITHERNPYACRVLLANRPFSRELLEELLGTRLVLIATAADRDRLSTTTVPISTAALHADPSRFTSPILDV